MGLKKAGMPRSQSQRAGISTRVERIAYLANSSGGAGVWPGSTHQEMAYSPYAIPMAEERSRVAFSPEYNAQRTAYQPIHTLISACQARPVNESEKGRSS